MILNQIIKNKRKELRELKKKFPLNSFKSKIKKNQKNNFKKTISKKGINLIAEIKKSSPSAGIIKKNFDFLKILKTYNKHKNIAAISILTDKRFFQGDINYIAQAKKLTKKPILRKDFIIDKYQIYETAYYGADAVLLIASILSKDKINYFIKLLKKFSIYAVVEVHTKSELKKVLQTKAEIIGINNRNLKSFKIDINNTLKLSKLIPKNKVIISESGFDSKKDIEKIKNNINAVLIGTSIMKSKNINKKINGLI